MENRYVDVVRGPYTINPNNTIDCEFLHPLFGWIPFTANPDDVESHGREIHSYIFSLIGA